MAGCDIPEEKYNKYLKNKELTLRDVISLKKVNEKFKKMPCTPEYIQSFACSMFKL